jgi:hypothetical protein
MYTKKVFIVPCISPLHVKRAICDKFGACEADNVQCQQSQKHGCPTANVLAASPTSSGAASRGRSSAFVRSTIQSLGCGTKRIALSSASRSASRRQACNKRPAGPGSSPARRKYQASRSVASSSVRPARRASAGGPGVGATGRRWGDRGRRPGGAPRERRRQESPLLRGFSAHCAAAPTPETAGPSGVWAR